MRNILLPTLWKYIFIEFYKLFFAILLYFISVILILKLQDIAHFITLRSSIREIFVFTLYQIPYILPFAIPLSCLLAAFLVVYRLSTSQEVTALQTSGISTGAIHTPFIWVGILTFLCNLFINFEVTPLSRARAKCMITQIVQSSPFLILQKKQYIGEKTHILRSKYGDTNDLRQFFFFGKTQKNRLYGIFADTLTMTRENVEAYNLATITTTSRNLDNEFPTIYMENQKKASMPISGFSSLFIKNNGPVPQEDLSTKMILIKIFASSIANKKFTQRGLLEIIKRFSFSFSSFTLVLIGISYGIQTDSSKIFFNIIMCCILTSSMFCCFLIAKSFEKYPLYAYYFYFVPHIVIVIFYFYKKRISLVLIPKKYRSE